MTSAPVARPPFDPELPAVNEVLPSSILLGDLERVREQVAAALLPVDEVIAADLSGLPPAFVDVCSTETFRDEDIAYATELGRAGVRTEPHVWPGGFHGFDSLAPDAPLAQQARAARAARLRRVAHF